MTEIEQQMQLILARPEDDEPRLAYATLIEADDPDRAEFIRAQVRSEAMSPLNPERRVLVARAQQLLRTHRREWVTTQPRKAGWTLHYHRGFLESVSTTLAGLKNAKWAWFKQPLLISVPASGSEEIKNLVHVTRLSLHSLNDETLRVILTSPNLGRLTHLQVTSSILGEVGFRALAECPGLADLRVLHLDYARHRADFTLPESALAALLDSPNVCNLHTLHLDGGRINDASARRLFRSPNLRRLERLNLQLNAITGAGIVDGPMMPNLRFLRMNLNGFGDAGAAALATLPLSRLNELQLNHNMIGGAGLTAMAEATSWQSLEWLSLSNNVINDAGATALASSRPLRTLRGLDLGTNLITDSGMLALGKSRSLNRLVNLVAISNPARAPLTTAVTERFKTQGPPLKDAPPVPAVIVLPRANVAPIGSVDEDGLIECIVSDPEDVMSRRIYADWLEENGAEHLAELIRLEAETPRVLSSRREELRMLLTARIKADFPRWANSVQFDRGLITARMQLRGVLTKAFSAEAPAWLRKHHIFDFHLNGSMANWGRLGEVTALGQMRGLNMSTIRIGNAGAGALGASQHLKGLFSLNLRGCRLYEEGFVNLFASGNLPRLRSLDISVNRPNLEGLRALGESPSAESLAVLTMTNCWCGSAGVAILAASPRLWNLRRLDVDSNRLNDQAVQALIDSPNMTNLRDLRLMRNLITDNGIRALIGSPLLSRLTNLVLTGNAFTGKASQSLAEAIRPISGLRLTLAGWNTLPAVREAITEMLGDRVTWQ